MINYYIVICTGIVHGIYGRALKEMAENKAKELSEKSGFEAIVVTSQSRPNLGEKWDEFDGNFVGEVLTKYGE